jgi:hypothetical protein
VIFRRTRSIWVTTTRRRRRIRTRTMSRAVSLEVEGDNVLPPTPQKQLKPKEPRLPP